VLFQVVRRVKLVNMEHHLKLRCFLFTVIAIAGILSCGQRDPYAAETSWVKRKALDLTYASESERQKLDLYYPEAGSGPFPVIAAIHGGAFKHGHKGDVQLEPVLQAVKRGYVVASINYRLSSEAQWPAAVDDVKAAIAWLKANASAHQLNPNKIAVWGSSAGGYLASMAGTSDDPQVQAVVSWFAPVSFQTIRDQLKDAEALQFTEGFLSEFMGQPIHEIPEKVNRANPETYMTIDDPPFLIQHGNADNVIPVQQSMAFADKLKATIGVDKVTLDIIEGAAHGDPVFIQEENIARILDWLDGVLR
jgi:acetyl esterase/lipase